jgi:lipopolysaccharide/colanic/teichoic acid biosynthesis glycosyltransferase
LVVAYLIKKEDGGPVFYKGERVGLHKKLFSMYKFRTMVSDAEKIGGPSTSENDPRITKVGKILRKFKLDELPQLFNVLKGEMSIVGPRPEVRKEVEYYNQGWDIIFSVKPGITDLSSIEFHNEGRIIAESGFDDPHDAYRMLIQPQKLRLQREYALNHSFIGDLKIIVRTISMIM